jgi:hypothetical protein
MTSGTAGHRHAVGLVELAAVLETLEPNQAVGWGVPVSGGAAGHVGGGLLDEMAALVKAEYLGQPGRVFTCENGESQRWCIAGWRRWWVCCR